MRVTAGIYKGRSLDNGKYEHLRPTADVVKQALFNALAFKVQGFKYKGWVEVIYEEGLDTFSVILKKTGKKVEDVYFDQLVEVIDSLVERTEDYEERVSKEYGFTA